MEKKFLRAFLFAISVSLAFIFSGCRAQTGTNDLPGLPKPGEITEFSELPFIDSVKMISFDDYPIASVKDIKVHDGHIYVLCDNGLIRFDAKGNFIDEISRKGRALNEWLRIVSFFFEDDETVCLVDCSGKILKFTLTGDYIGILSYSADALFNYANRVVPMSGGGYLISNGIYKEYRDVFVFCSSDLSKANVLKDVKLNAPCLMKAGGFSSYKGTYRAVLPFDNCLYSISPEGMVPDYILPRMGKRVPSRKIDWPNDYTIDYILDLKYSQNMDIGFDSIAETSRFIILSRPLNLEYYIYDKQSDEAWLFRPALFPSEQVNSFYNLTGAMDDDILISYRYSLDLSATDMCIYYLKN